MTDLTTYVQYIYIVLSLPVFFDRSSYELCELPRLDAAVRRFQNCLNNEVVEVREKRGLLGEERIFLTFGQSEVNF